ncbi:hypothetical protein Glove_382g72 [Diversispora epigaea]|uniref:Uncharacterized protein n=1 Tax=Diversispora epigaea TaxID=1348612 RepID=A0A397H596_9GLOM|nr:hypothetical protein Glove_382g72 [Diversispora epigaea]
MTRTSDKSQSISRSYGSNLPTSLTYIVLSTRGCSPWRPAAVMSTTWHENKSLPWSRPTVKKKRELFPRPPLMSPSSVALPL